MLILGLNQSQGQSDLGTFLRQGKLQGHGRIFTLSTFNMDGLKDFTSTAFGARIGYISTSYQGLSFEFSYDYVTEIYSSSLFSESNDSLGKSKWELELYDIETPQKRFGIGRLGKAFVQYENPKFQLRLGRQDLNTPLLNKRDGRLMSFQFGGAYGSWKLTKCLNMNFGWVQSVGIRSVGTWYSFNDAIGKVGKGRTSQGAKGNYQGLTGSNGIGIISLQYKGQNSAIELWNFHLDNINTTYWLEGHKGFENLELGLQVVAQGPVKDASSDYLQGNGDSRLAGAQVKYSIDDNKNISLSGTLIDKHGKFLFPRELGREKLFTSMPRHWLEGLAKTKAYTLKWNSMKKYSKNAIGLSYVDAPEQEDFPNNKYLISDHIHLNIQQRWYPKQFKDKLVLELLYVFRKNLVASYSPAVTFNKTNYNQVNLIGTLAF